MAKEDAIRLFVPRESRPTIIPLGDSSRQWSSIAIPNIKDWFHGVTHPSPELRGRVFAFCGHFGDLWGAIRNSVGLVFAVIKILAITGAITLAPHAFAIMLALYGCFILIQALNTLILFSAGAVKGNQMLDKAMELQDTMHLKDIGSRKFWCSMQLRGYATQVGAFGSLVEGAFWLAIALVDFCGLVTLSAQLMHFLFTYVFNTTFALAIISGVYGCFRRQPILEMCLSGTLATIRQRLTEGGDEAIAKLQVEFAEYTSDDLLVRVLASKGEDEQLLSAIRTSVMKKQVADILAIVINGIGIGCWFDRYIPNAIASDIVDWVLWIVLNLSFYFCLSHPQVSDALQESLADKWVAPDSTNGAVFAPVPA